MRILLTMLMVLLPLCAQEKQEDKGGQKKGPPRPPQNLKVLKVESGAEVGQIMRTFTAGLGVQCNYCHIQGNMASDENPKKEIARHMITMVREINAKFPDGKEHVTCYTCHRGAPEPATEAPAAAPAGQ